MRRIGFAGVAFAVAVTLCGGAQASAQTLLDKVLAKGEIRCGYIPWPPQAIKDPNTGKLSGVFPDVMEKIGQNAGLKIVWVEEVSYGTAIEGMKTKRYDMLCTPAWPNSDRGKQASFSAPLSYSVTEAYGRADENRIKKLDDINSPDIAISAIDGEVGEAVARQDFPKARRVSLPAMTDISSMFNEIATKKADVLFTEPSTAYDYMSKNPGKAKRLLPGKPLRVYPNVFMLPKGEEEFRDFFDIALREVLYTGYVDMLVKKYGADKFTYPVALPYRGGQ